MVNGVHGLSTAIAVKPVEEVLWLEIDHVTVPLRLLGARIAQATTKNIWNATTTAALWMVPGVDGPMDHAVLVVEEAPGKAPDSVTTQLPLVGASHALALHLQKQFAIHTAAQELVAMPHGKSFHQAATGSRKIL